MNKANFKIDKKLVKATVFGIIIGCLITMIVTLIAAVVFLKSGKMPGEIVGYITLSFLGIGSLAGGYVCARIYKSSGIMCGAAVGIPMFIITLIVGMTNFVGNIGIMLLLKFATIMLTAVIGGILGVNKKDKIRIK
ncbi:MAG: TIGR04086 family membrane protein [Ruminococcus sp.]|nr:TIGR04086 family membrane protein [Ruminococcus sp.]